MRGGEEIKLVAVPSIAAEEEQAHPRGHGRSCDPHEQRRSRRRLSLTGDHRTILAPPHAAPAPEAERPAMHPPGRGSGLPSGLWSCRSLGRWAPRLAVAQDTASML